MLLCPRGGARIDGRVYRCNRFTKDLETFCEGDVVFRSGLKERGLEVGKFTPSSPNLARHRATILKYLEKGGP